MDRWSAKPKVNCFSIVGSDELAFYMPCIQLVNEPGGYRVHFLHNPDRIGWLLSFDLPETPVAIYDEFDIEKSGAGLGIRPMLNDENLRLPGNFDPAPIVDAIHAQEESIHNCESKLKDQMLAVRNKRMACNPRLCSIDRR